MKALIMSTLLIFVVGGTAFADDETLIDCLIDNSPQDMSLRIINGSKVDTADFFDKNQGIYLDVEQGKVTKFTDDTFAFAGTYEGKALTLTIDQNATERSNAVLKIGGKAQNIECFSTDFNLY